MSNLPNFIIIGAGKSGTTALYEYLASHPEVYVSPVKETNFFALEGEQLIDGKDDPEQMHHYPWSITDWESYQQLFANVNGEKAIGEVSPMYLYSPEAAKKIKDRLPNVKIIAILREPVDRLHSRYMHLARENREPTATFEEALDRTSIWWKRNDLIREGFYYTHLQQYYQLFDPAQIRVYFYDDFRKDPISLVQDLFSFIGVDPTFLPDLSAEFNVSGRIKNKSLDKWIGQDSLLKKGLERTVPSLMTSVKKNQRLRKFINQLRKKNLQKEPLKKETRRALIDQVYKTEIEDLQKLLQRDLSHWLN